MKKIHKLLSIITVAAILPLFTITFASCKPNADEISKNEPQKEEPQENPKEEIPTSATSSDNLIFVEAKADGLNITTNLSASYSKVYICVKSSNTKKHLPSLKAEAGKTSFLYPFTEKDEIYEVFLQMTDSNYTTSTSKSVKVRATGGLGDFSIAYSKFSYNSKSTSILLEDYVFTKPENLSVKEEGYGANYSDSNWSNYNWFYLIPVLDSANGTLTASFNLSNYTSSILNKSFYILIMYTFSYENTSYELELMNNYDGYFTDVHSITGVQLSSGTLIPKFSVDRFEYSIYGKADSVTITPLIAETNQKMEAVTLSKSQTKTFTSGANADAFEYKFTYKNPEKITFTDSTNTTYTYLQTFYDDFDGNKVDTSVWTIRDERRDGSDQKMYNWWKKEAVSVKGGNLVIEGWQENDKLISGAITTQNKFEQSHGLFEIRFKCEKSSGLWYAFWLMDENNNKASIDGSPVDAAELDIFEIIPKTYGWTLTNADSSTVTMTDNYFRTAINYDSYNYDYPEGVNHPVYFSPQAPDVTDDSFYNKWHTVKFLWGEDNYEMWLDGKLQYVMEGRKYGGICDGTNFIIISSELANGGWGGPLDESYYPSRFTVDYVKAYIKE